MVRACVHVSACIEHEWRAQPRRRPDARAQSCRPPPARSPASPPRRGMAPRRKATAAGEEDRARSSACILPRLCLRLRSAMVMSSVCAFRLAND